MTDSNNCEAVIESIEIEEPDNALALQLTITPPACHGDSNAVVTCAASGGWGDGDDYKFAVAVADTDASFTMNNEYSEKSAGSYTFFVRENPSNTDEYCIVEQQIEIIQPDALNTAVDIEQVRCFGDATGEVVFTPEGGNGGYSLNFDDTERDSLTVSNLKMGSYNYFISDTLGCSINSSVSITQPDEPLSVLITKNDYNGHGIRCYGLADTLALQLQGATPGYDVVHNTNNRKAVKIDAQHFLMDNLTAGDHVFTITDSNNCTYEAEANLTQPPAIRFGNTRLIEPTCYGYSNGKITGNLSGGAPSVTENRFYVDFFHGDSRSIQTDGAYAFDSISQGVVSIEVTDLNGCSARLDTVMAQPQPITLDLGSSPVSCVNGQNGSVWVDAVIGGVAPATFTWFDSSMDAVSHNRMPENLPAGEYFVEVLDGNGCSPSNNQLGSVQIDEPNEPLALEVVAYDTVSCYGRSDGFVRVAGSGGWGAYSFRDNYDDWSTLSSFTDMLAGSKQFYVRDSLNCVETIEFVVEEPEPLLISRVQVTEPLCFGQNNGRVSISATGGNSVFSYKLNNREQTDSIFQQVAAGSYSIQVADEKGCSRSSSVVVNQPPQLDYTFSHIGRPTCGNSNGTLTLDAEGGSGDLSLQWQGIQNATGFEIDSLPAGNYPFMLTDSNSCTLNGNALLENIQGPDIDLVDVQYPKCSYSDDGAITVAVSGPAAPFSINWYSQGTEISSNTALHGLPGGTYTLAVADTNSCVMGKTIELAAPKELHSDVYYKNVDCKGANTGKLSVRLSGGTAPYEMNFFVNNSWGVLNNADTVTLPRGEYPLRLKDANNCIINPQSNSNVFDTVSIEEPLLPVSAGVEAAPTKCFGTADGVALVSAMGGWQYSGYEYAVGQSGFSTSRRFSALTPGTHTAKEQNGLG
jgi:hypothetical protein